MLHLRRGERLFDEISLQGFAAPEQQNDLVTSPSGAAPSIQSVVKRASDVVFALVMIILFAPLMLFIALLIWRGDGAPFFFAHERVGRDGRVFKCLKFRTMVRNSQRVLDDLLARDDDLRRQWLSTYKLNDDPRVIPRIGALLRKSSLDELPQLFNVLWGDMSLVGPRPVVADELDKYGAYRHHYMAVKPGLTGLWQVGGRSNASYDTRVSMDVWYVENAGLRTDLTILLQTAMSFVTGRLDGAR